MAASNIKAFNRTYTGLTIFIFMFIGAWNFFAFGRVGYNKNALIIYTIGAAMAIVFSLVFYLLQNSSISLPFKAGGVSESSKEFPLSMRLGLKFGTHIIWAIVIAFLSFGGTQIFPDPNLYQDVSSFATGQGVDSVARFGLLRSVYEVGFAPAGVEDMNALGMSAVFVVLILLSIMLIRKLSGMSFFDAKKKAWYYFAIIIACPITALVFSTAHEAVAGQNIPFFIIAWAFQTVNLYVMWFTGLFFPLAHFIHNSIFVLGFAIALSIAFIFIPFFKGRNKNMED
jgi:hypothetical protein